MAEMFWEKTDNETTLFKGEPLEIKDGEMSHKCNQCEYIFSHASNLDVHMKTHRTEKSHKCYICDYASSNAASVRRHLMIHFGEKSHKFVITGF